MKILPLDSCNISEVATYIRSGGIVIHPTETCYGITCDVTNAVAVQKLFSLKQRPISQPVSALYPSLVSAKEDLLFSPLASSIAQKYLPGPLTIVLPVRQDPHFYIHVTADSKPAQTIGLRISSHLFTQSLVQAVGSPIATTSANLHGKENPYSAEDVRVQLGDNEYLLIDGGMLAKTPPSTVVEIIGSNWKILRQGDIDLQSMLP